MGRHSEPPPKDNPKPEGKPSQDEQEPPPKGTHRK